MFCSSKKIIGQFRYDTETWSFQLMFPNSAKVMDISLK